MGCFNLLICKCDRVPVLVYNLIPITGEEETGISLSSKTTRATCINPVSKKIKEE